MSEVLQLIKQKIYKKININIEEPEKAKKLTNTQYFKGFSKPSPIQATLKQTE